MSTAVAMSRTTESATSRFRPHRRHSYSSRTTYVGWPSQIFRANSPDKAKTVKRCRGLRSPSDIVSNLSILMLCTSWVTRRFAEDRLVLRWPFAGRFLHYTGSHFEVGSGSCVPLGIYSLSFYSC
jgi:hypothetical protein